MNHKMSDYILPALASVVAVLAGGVASAHHSGAMFDPAKDIVLDGTVKDFQWTNPHSWLQVVAPVAGSTGEWSIECGSPNTLFRHGWHQTSFKAGDHVVVHIHPMKDGSKGGQFMNAVLADGSKL